MTISQKLQLLLKFRLTLLIYILISTDDDEEEDTKNER
jgi:hypothetical protein